MAYSTRKIDQLLSSQSTWTGLLSISVVLFIAIVATITLIVSNLLQKQAQISTTEQLSGISNTALQGIARWHQHLHEDLHILNQSETFNTTLIEFLDSPPSQRISSKMEMLLSFLPDTHEHRTFALYTPSLEVITSSDTQLATSARVRAQLSQQNTIKLTPPFFLENNEFSVVASVAISTPQDEIIAILAIITRPVTIFNEILSNIQKSTRIQLHLLDTQGRLLTSTEEEAFRSQTAFFNHPKPQLYHIQNDKGQEIVGIWTDHPKEGVMVLAEQEEASAFTYFYQTRNILFTYAFIFLACTLTLIYFINKERQRNRINEYFFRAVTDNAAEGIITTDEHGNIITLNKYAERLFGYSAKSAVGKNVSMLIPSPHREQHNAYIENYKRTGQTTIIGKGREVIAHHQEGSEIPLFIAVNRIDIDDQLYFTAMFHDISAQKQAEENLKRHRDELIRSNRELEQFAYIASHDLQEPLRMVSSYLSLIKERNYEQLDQDSKEFIEYAVDGATRMQGLIQALLFYSRINTKEKTVDRIDSGKIVEVALRNLEIAIKESQATIKLKPLPIIKGDKRLILQLFQNLVANAIKYRSDHPLVITISAEHIDHSHHRGELNIEAGWIFSIQDNGIGFKMEYSQKIFQIFQRLQTREHSSGTGIGLAVCRRIVERHGGQIWSQSEEKKGATFYFSIPDEFNDLICDITTEGTRH